MGISERGKEIKRRRHRKAKMTQLRKRAAKATESEKVVIAAKIRALTPGAEGLIATLGLEPNSKICTCDVVDRYHDPTHVY